ncbi:MAG: cobalamin-dependent protein [Planctomycetes bacterium]|nr:cobalamin-dependent protein [Planctomycetota bacterium]
MNSRGRFAAELLTATPRALAAAAVERQMAEAQSSVECFGADAFTRVLEDTELRLRYLAEAVAVGRPALFDDHVRWAIEAHLGRDIPTSYLQENLAALEYVCREHLPTDAFACVEPVLRAGRARASEGAPPTSSVLSGTALEIKLARQFLVAVLEGDGERALDLVLAPARSGAMPPGRLAEAVIGRALEEIGRLWQIGDASVADEHLCSRVAERALAALAAIGARSPRTGLRVATLSVGGELHDIGIRLVADAFAAAGWQVLHLGANMPGEHLMQAMRDPGIDLLAVATTLSLHLRNTSRLIELVRLDAEFDHVPILVGGAPFRIAPDLWREMGADGTASTAEEAVATGTRLVEERRNRVLRPS